MAAAAAWLFVGWVIVSNGRPFSYQGGTTPIALDVDSGPGALLALVVMLGSLAVWWGGAAWVGGWTYLRLQPRLAAQIGDHNTFVGAVLGSVSGLVIASGLLFVMVAWLFLVAVVYALVVVAGFVVLAVVGSALSR